MNVAFGAKHGTDVTVKRKGKRHRFRISRKFSVHESCRLG